MDMNIQVHTFVTLTAEIAERMKKPDVRYYIFGEGTYKDTTTEHEIHHTHYCMYVRYGITGVTPCTSNQYKTKQTRSRLLKGMKACFKCKGSCTLVLWFSMGAKRKVRRYVNG